MAKKKGAAQKKYEASEELASLTGKRKATRGEFLKRVWAYADDNGLKTQKKYKGRNCAAIELDDELKDVFGRKKVITAPEIMKGLSGHLFSD